MPETAIVWFRRDLRLADNSALEAACQLAERVVAVYVHAPDEEGDWRPGAASDWWLHHSLAALSDSLHARGGSLLIRRGSSLDELLRLARETGATQVYWNRLYEPRIEQRDARIKLALREAGCTVESFNAALLFEPWQVLTGQETPYRVFTPFWRECSRRLDSLPLPTPAPERIVHPGRAVSSLPLDALELLPRASWGTGISNAWRPGEDAALERLESFLVERLSRYPGGRNRPDLADTSRLSPHLHFGEIGPRQCLAAVRAALPDQPADKKAAEEFLREIGWREFAHHLLHHYPHTPEQPLDARFERFPWKPDPGLLRAWQRGRTGIPMVDAGMRELWETGWMHNRVRMVVASFLTKNLLQGWLDGARWFWDTLVDADLASNTLGWQWTAGCGADAAPYFRIFNPVLQAERHDPARDYIRRWIPELARLPDSHVHRPWEAPPAMLTEAGVALGRDYPEPVADLGASRRAALAAYALIKAGT